MNSVREIRPWADKARALDRYRWLLLRERHGVFSSALRFLREALSDLAFGLRARWRLRPGVEAELCDFLLLQSAPKVIALRRKILLIERLRSRGHVLDETALPDSADILAQRLLLAPHALGRAHDDRVVDLALLHASARRGVLHRHLDHVADVRVPALAAAEHLDTHDRTRARVIGDVQHRLHLDHL